MKALLKATRSSLEQIQLIVEMIEEGQKETNENIYAESGIGRHIRHVTDHFLALKNGLDNLLVNYNHRHRDSLIETSLKEARAILVYLQDWLSAINSENLQLVIKSEINCEKEESVKIFSSIERELLYLINHTIHHAAYIKLLLQHYQINLPDEIGIAPGTATYFRQVAKDKIETTLQSS
ncbi:MAG TPA: hypothetical protein ENJ60_05330 [Aeromonadales bacterium]|nr:hypothetical protein [Aeromonadales bacterium]